MTFGDIFALMSLILGSAGALWAGMTLSAIFFPDRTLMMSKRFEHHPFKTFLLGLLFFAPVTVVGILLLGPAPPLGVTIFIAEIGVIVFGAGGFARFAARRIEEHGGATSEYDAIARGAGLLVLAQLMPLFGWLLMVPYVLIASFGAGCLGIVSRRVAIGTAAPPTLETP